MKKFIVLVIMLLAVSIAGATVDVTEINFSNVQAGNFDRYLQGWIGTLNTDIVNAAFPSNVGTGRIFYVDSAVGVTGSTGKTPATATATIDAAVNLCSGSRGDVIYVMQGHSETLASAGSLVTCDVVGVTILGLGAGTDRPSITLSDDEAIAFDIDAANVTISNIYIDATGADLVAKPIDVGAARCTIDNVEILMADGTGQAVTAITTSGAANAADYLTITNCRFVAPNAGAAEAILLEEVEEGVVISGCYIYGAFTVAPIHNPTGKVLTNLLVKNCFLKNDDAGEFALELVSACTGFLIENYYHTDAAATLVDSGACFSFECYGIDDVDEGAFIRPAVGTP